jgi:ABC-type branched-subunit amino acid transport system ATPase component/predicted MFS family arabinose efflux permease
VTSTDESIAGLAGTLVAEEEQRRGERRAADLPTFATDELPGVGKEPMSVRAGLRRGGGPFVFVVLLVLNSIDELETAVLGVLAPDIRDTFGLSDGMTVFLTSTTFAVFILGAVPLGWLADRFRRGPIIGFSTAVFGGMVFLSGLAVNAFMLFGARLLAGLAKGNTGPVHTSLLADTYPIETRGRISALTRTAQGFLGALGPLAVGGIAAAVGGVEGWRVAYVVLGLPVAVLAIVAFFLPEPPRGQWEKTDVVHRVVEDDDLPPVSFEAAVARLRGIRTLNVLVLGTAAIGFGLFTYPVLANLFLEDRYDLGSAGRGAVATATLLAGLAVLPFVGRLYDRLYQRDPARAVRLTGLMVLPAGALLPLQFLMPNAVLFTIVSLPYVVLLSAAFAMVFPLLQSIVPYRLRALGGSVGMVYVFFVGATGGALLSLPISNAWGPEWAVPLLGTPATALGGWLILRGARHVRGDLALVVAELRDEAAEHQRRVVDPDHVPVLQVAGVDYSYGPVQVLFDVGLEVAQGEVLALLGSNGAGKSTILRVVAGLGTPERGAVRLHGRDVTYVAPEHRVRMGIVSLAGGDGVFPTMSVRENLEMGAFVLRADAALVQQRIERVLDTFPDLRDRLDLRAGSLSGGQQQMLAFGMALLHDPEILLIDELSLGLAPTVVSDLIAVVERLRRQGLAMVIVEQSLNVALAVADRALFLEKGRVRFAGPTAELAERGDLVRAVFLGSEGGG